MSCMQFYEGTPTDSLVWSKSDVQHIVYNHDDDADDDYQLYQWYAELAEVPVM